MTSGLLLSLAFAAFAHAAPDAGALAESALLSQAPEASRLEVGEVKVQLSSDCRIERAEAPALKMSGRVAVKLRGVTASNKSCSGWAWARIRLFSKAFVLARDVQRGESVSKASREEERELSSSKKFLSSIPEGSTAVRALPKGTVLDESHLKSSGPQLGRPVTVVVKTDTLTVVQQGRSAPCSKGKSCAVLPTGKRVEGDWVDGQLQVTP